ncbi:hypothetical protein BMS3Abin03_02965 [bacterium BMS3Abin03]|nr:hypothetical protein BMS3Abin03_02965 [bacterium BMS3Abin03]
MKHTITFLLLLQFFVNSQSYAQWYPQNSGITDNLYDVQFVNENTGWILDNLQKKYLKRLMEVSIGFYSLQILQIL